VGLLRAIICTSQAFSLQAGFPRSTFDFKRELLSLPSRWAAVRTYNNMATSSA
jgi:hypothetical protein